MILIAIAVLASMAVGVAARRRDERADRVVTWSLDLVLWVLLPLVAFAFASRLTLDASTLIGLLAGYGVVATVGLLAWRISGRYLHLTRSQQGGLVLATILANTGYFGLPVCLTLLGRDDFPGAVAWDQIISGPMALLVAPFVAASFAGVHEDAHAGQRLVAVLKRAPAIPALILGLVVGSWVPHWLLDVATYAVYATLPLGFFAVGATIERLRGREQRPPARAIGLVLGLRIAVAPALYALLAWLVLPDEPRAFLLQAAMPSGINALVVGHAFDLDRGIIATAIAISTTIVLTAALVGSLVT